MNTLYIHHMVSFLDLEVEPLTVVAGSVDSWPRKRKYFNVI